MYTVRQYDFYFEVVDVHPRGDIVEARYATEDEAIAAVKELNILTDLQEQYEEQVHSLQASLREWVNTAAYRSGVDVTVLETHLGYGENTEFGNGSHL